MYHPKCFGYLRQKALVEDKEVTIKAKFIFEAQSARPSEFKFNYTIIVLKKNSNGNFILTGYPEKQ